jgi:hypothetical protein
MKRLLILAVAMAAAIVGCESGPKTAPGGVARGRVPEYAAVAEAYNQRVQGLDHLWSRGTIRVEYPGQDGKAEQAQVETNLQVVLPAKVNLTLDKAGPLAVLGSNDEQYWYIDLQTKEHTAKVGEHGKATAQGVAELGVPVYPLDLIELVGITPQPTSWPSVGTGEAPDLRWSTDGRSLILTTPGRTGPRRLYLDPDTFRPSRIDLTGPGGKVLVTAELSRYERVAGAPGMVATQIEAELDEGRTRVRLRLDEPAANHTIKPVAFNLDALLKAYNVREVESLDTLAAP